MTTSPRQILIETYQQAQHKITFKLSEKQQDWCNTIVSNAETQKAVLAVVITSLTKKIDDSQQDIRQHKIELENGYSGRSYDFNYVTPFLQEFFPRYAMAESGWLTRSLEQVHAFTLDFPGKIRNTQVKEAFLKILDDIETNNADVGEYLETIIYLLLELQELQIITIPAFRDESERTIQEVINLLKQHFFEQYTGAGAARLPVIAIYTAYEFLITHTRYAGKQLLPLKSHTTSDIKSSSLADVEVQNADGDFFEVVEVKHGKPITPAMIRIAYEQIKPHALNRYYFLTTADPNVEDNETVSNLLRQIRREHGCEIVVNGVINSIKYYLRIIGNTQDFIQSYTENLVADYEKGTDIKKTHVDKWLDLLKQ